MTARKKVKQKPTRQINGGGVESRHAAEAMEYVGDETRTSRKIKPKTTRRTGSWLSAELTGMPYTISRSSARPAVYF
jgi:hypothetical protein